MSVLSNQTLVVQPARWLRGLLQGTQGPTRWQDSSWLPPHDGKQWALLVRGGPVTAATLDEVKSRLHGWSPASAILLASPGQLRFGPVAAQPELARWLRRQYTTGQVVCGCIFLALSISALLGFVSRPKLPLVGHAITAAIVAIVCLLEAHWTTQEPQHLAERNLFFYWLAKGPVAREAFCFWAIVCVVAGLTQLAVAEALGGVEPLIIRYGAYDPASENHEYWRLLTGPFLHASVAHFLTNSTFLLLIGTVATAALGRVGAVVFLVGTVAGAWAAAYEAMLAAPESAFDATTGFSAGIYALLALMIVAAQFDRGLLPRGAALQLLALATIGVVSSTLIVANVSTVSHLAGMAAGAIAGPLAGWPRRRTPVLAAQLRSRAP